MTMDPRPPFAHQLLLVAGTLVLLALVWKLADVFVLAFGAIVVAVALRALVRRVERLGVPARYSFMASLLLVLLAGVATIAWVGDPLAAQLSRLREGLPASRGWERTASASLRWSTGSPCRTMACLGGACSASRVRPLAPWACSR
jgi:predicted PurR-regulated permease PerM